jgi:tetratricopeptide (TPR) repeat protein
MFFEAHLNYSNLLILINDDFAASRKHLEIALDINSKDGQAHFNLALLLKKYYREKEKIMFHYFEAIKYKPELQTNDAETFFSE